MGAREGEPPGKAVWSASVAAGLDALEPGGLAFKQRPCLCYKMGPTPGLWEDGLGRGAVGMTTLAWVIGSETPSKAE